MRFCPYCDKDVSPVIEMGGDTGNTGMVQVIKGFIEKCPNCGTFVGEKQKSSLDPEPSTSRPITPKKVKAPTDLLGMARSRLEEVEEEIVRYESLLQERTQLKAMIAAAERLSAIGTT